MEDTKDQSDEHWQKLKWDSKFKKKKSNKGIKGTLKSEVFEADLNLGSEVENQLPKKSE